MDPTPRRFWSIGEKQIFLKLQIKLYKIINIDYTFSCSFTFDFPLKIYESKFKGHIYNPSPRIFLKYL